MASRLNHRQSPRELLQEHIRRALVDKLSDVSIDWTVLDTLRHPVLRIEACLEERPAEPTRQSTPGLLVSRIVDLSEVARETSRISTPAAPDVPTGLDAPTLSRQKPGVILPAARNIAHTDSSGGQTNAVSNSVISPTSPAASSDDDELDETTHEPVSPAHSTHRQGLGGLRPARSDATTVQTEPDGQRQIQSGDRFPKRRKLKPVGHFLKPSTLDKLITGIWEQVHGDTNSDPRSLLEPLRLQPMNQLDNGGGGGGGGGSSSSKLALTPAPFDAGVLDKSMVSGGGSFSRSNAFCRQVTQASRACRSLEVIVQARWVELFEEYVDGRAAANPSTSRTKHNKAALLEACADFGWSEKELRNKMYVWRGYKEIKDAGGWAALIFSGMGIYRFCKYRIGFDHDSMQRLRGIRPALEVAADTLHPNWRQLLSVVGESRQRLYDGHPHDWVVCFDGSDPLPLATTYFQWDPNFSYRQLDESIIDQAAWGCDDPRWTPPPVAVMRGTALPVCETCGKEQSDDAAQNNCYCFPSLFGCAKTNPSPVMVFHTPDGRNNGLIALCAFERGAPVGEFVGLVTKGFQDVDVMESSTALEKYQIWQGRQGNFTRFVNHSCKANAQYQRFTWMNTQRVILVSKGIEAGTEITVDYSEKYWKGLDKKCLCGESCCKYRRT